MKKILSMIFFVLFAVTANVSAADNADYIWEFEGELPVEKILEAVNDEDDFDHSIYYMSKSDHKSLIFVCHGWVDNGEYGIVVNNADHYDYVAAVTEAIENWQRRGKLNVPFENVVLVACYSGYAPRVVQMPELGTRLIMAIDNKAPNGISEEFEEDGTLRGISLWRAVVPMSLGRGEKTRMSHGRRATEEETKKIFVP